jgi:hypothetical protein
MKREVGQAFQTCASFIRDTQEFAGGTSWPNEERICTTTDASE